MTGDAFSVRAAQFSNCNRAQDYRASLAVHFLQGHCSLITNRIIPPMRSRLLLDALKQSLLRRDDRDRPFHARVAAPALGQVPREPTVPCSRAQPHADDEVLAGVHIPRSGQPAAAGDQVGVGGGCGSLTL